MSAKEEGRSKKVVNETGRKNVPVDHKDQEQMKSTMRKENEEKRLDSERQKLDLGNDDSTRTRSSAQNKKQRVSSSSDAEARSLYTE